LWDIFIQVLKIEKRDSQTDHEKRCFYDGNGMESNQLKSK